jgi:hypothetical protein
VEAGTGSAMAKSGTNRTLSSGSPGFARPTVNVATTASTGWPTDSVGTSVCTGPGVEVSTRGPSRGPVEPRADYWSGSGIMKSRTSAERSSDALQNWRSVGRVAPNSSDSSDFIPFAS